MSNGNSKDKRPTPPPPQRIPNPDHRRDGGKGGETRHTDGEKPVRPGSR